MRKEGIAVKHILLVRHATAAKRDPEKVDFTRSLKKSGRKEAREMCKRLDELKLRPKLFISSPANRALETAEIFAKGLGRSVKKISKRDELYGEMSPEGFLELIRGLDDKVESAIIFGHDPAFSDFARFIVPGFDTDLPKAGVMGIEVDVATWKDVTPTLARKTHFFYPGDSADTKTREKEVRREIGTRIEKSIARVIADFGIDGNEKLVDELHRTSTRLAKQLAPLAAGAAPPAASNRVRSRRKETRV
jgi:phosphohistidine phosphatase